MFIPDVKQSVGVTSSDVRQRVEMRHSSVDLLHRSCDSRCVARRDSRRERRERREDSRLDGGEGPIDFYSSGQACQAMEIRVDPGEAENVTGRSNTGWREMSRCRYRLSECFRGKMRRDGNGDGWVRAWDVSAEAKR